MKVLTEKMRSCRQGPAEWFSGTVWLEEVVTALSPAAFKAVRVTFEPGARTAWHTHPLGQALHVVAGMGLVQLKGEPAQQIGPGDTVWFEPDELHWHGAAPGRMLVHLAMQRADVHGVDVVWLQHVTDEEYSLPEYHRQQIEEGIREDDAGQVVSHERVVRGLADRIVSQKLTGRG